MLCVYGPGVLGGGQKGGRGLWGKGGKDLHLVEFKDGVAELFLDVTDAGVG